jgi:uncharacterized protein YjbI with pentapeptide repeats
VSRLLLLLTLLALPMAVAEARAGTSPSASGCVLTSPGPARPEFHAERILECIKQGLPVDLRRVRLVGTGARGVLDLTRIPVSPLPESGRIGRSITLDAAAIERGMGRTVRGVRVVRERFIVRDSEVAVEIRGPAATKHLPGTFAPLVFAKIVNFEGSHFMEPVALPGVRFFGDVSFKDSRFTVTNGQSQDLAASHFTGDFDFRCARSKTTDPGYFSFQGAVFSGKVRFGCSGNPPQIGYLDFSNARFEGPWTRFDDRVFVRGANFTSATFTQKAYFVGTRFEEYAGFNQTIFQAGAAFNDARFLTTADFTLARFLSPAGTSFDGATFTGKGVFRGVSFESETDWVGVDARDASLDFNGVVFGGPANFHLVKMAAVNFHEARFRKTARFTSARFGAAASCGRLPSLSVSLERTTFDSGADLTAARFATPVNVSYTAYGPGQLRIAWHQIADRIALRSTRLADDAACPLSRQTFDDRLHPDVMPTEEFYRVLEANFRQLGQLSDATEAYYRREHAETRRLRNGGRWAVGRLFEEHVWGYGVRPSRVLRTWLVVTMVGVAVYLFVGSRSVNVRTPFGVPRFRPATLPVIPEEPDWLSATRPDDAGWVRRIGRAVALSLQVSTGLEVSSARLRIDDRHVVVGFMAVQRMCGYLLLGAFVVTTAQSVPVIGQILSFVLK